jgi:hypothetical protein
LERESNGRIDLAETGPGGTTFSVMVTGENLAHHEDIPAPTSGADHSLSVAESVLPAIEKSDGPVD